MFDMIYKAALSLKQRSLKLIRSFVVSNDEEALISLGRLITNPKECLIGQNNPDIFEYPEFGGTFSLPNLKFKSGDHTFGWIEGIEVNRNGGVATINHIATQNHLVGLGLGRRIAYGIASLLQERYQIKEIHFCETHSTKRDDYHKFFTKKLDAKHISERFSEKWVWVLPANAK